MKISVQNNTVSLEFPKATRTKAQEHALKTMIKDRGVEAAIRYLKTFIARPTFGSKFEIQQAIRHSKLTSYGDDQLQIKGKNSTLHALRRMFDTSQTHKPIGKYTNWIGVEIECCIPFHKLGVDGSESSECSNCCGSGYLDNEDGESYECDTCNGNGEIEPDEDNDSDANHRSARRALKGMIEERKIKHVSIKSDGSIEHDDDSFPIEIAILTKLDEPKNLEMLCTLLNELKATVNKTCGLHVHLDARHLGLEEVRLAGRNLGKALPVLAGMVPQTRRENTYCQLQVSSSDRYSAVNLCAYEKYKTIEMRLHSGTTNFRKILSWAKIIHAISNSYVPRTVHSINELTDHVQLSEELVEYMGQRTALFNGESVQLEFQDTDESEAS